MNPWVQKKKRTITIILGVILSAALVILLLPFILQSPTCADGKQNGDERGVDCGGSCAQYCQSQINDVVVEYATIHELIPGVYNAIAYLHNPNDNAAMGQPVPYTFTLVDAENNTLAERSGSIRLGPQETAVATEHRIAVPEGTPTNAFFSFDGIQPWYKVDGSRITLLPVAVVERRLENPDTDPVLRVRLLNDGLVHVNDLRVATILYDEEGEVVAVGETVLDSLAEESSEVVIFTWPSGFDRTIDRVEVVPHFNPFTIQF